MSSLLKLTDVAVERGGKVLLASLHCDIQAGEVTVVLGPNGAGKSSLLLALAGLIPFSGLMLLHGKNLFDLSRAEHARQIAWQGELPPTEFGLMVAQRLELAAEAVAADIAETVVSMDITALLNKPLGELSSGERQRVELAALMLRDTPIWLLDEPTAHLDLKHQVECLNIFRRQAKQGRAIITVLHDLQQAATIADRVIIIDGHGDAQHGSAEKMLEIGRLSGLFDTPLLRQGKAILPDYGEVAR